MRLNLTCGHRTKPLPRWIGKAFVRGNPAAWCPTCRLRVPIVMDKRARNLQ